ncbi:GNAT family N-acetyltransferase [Allosaccharopolyspora coralli]|uniref:GNAT family N-acetyltransferase n=1 Tax=Allosaccharopolyspora coralli TaxID=2665642 RepID=A0A5Q3QHY4_9PSEU|nr:GNAT family N-acyltransferase [Allosaccharopolyspora coralli]QGK71125.1 GNAT family N-acetyltransferase [Allosaccharopolyspora coralli]
MPESQLLISTAPTGARSTDQPHYSLLVARETDEVRAAQRLRYQVFAEEMGAQVEASVPGAEADAFDEFCDHLIVRNDHTGEVVGTYRMLPPERAEAAGGLYSETEFDLSALRSLRPALVETGRSCVHRDHRSGAVVSLVWAGIARYMYLHGHTWLAGCASVPLYDGGAVAGRVWDTVSEKHYAPDEFRVRPYQPWEPVAGVTRGSLPPLLRGYLRLGAWVCGPPALDADFGVADFFVLLNLPNMDQRYLRYFLGGTQ